MAGTFSQVYIQVVFAVKGRENLIGKTWKDEFAARESPCRPLQLIAMNYRLPRGDERRHLLDFRPLCLESSTRHPVGQVPHLESGPVLLGSILELRLAILGKALRSGRLTRSKSPAHDTDLNIQLGQSNG